ncbi:hypothetical protein [Vibrio parahaemolyticus]|uniref:DUF4145 domain-containing protein n=2 Tax=Vibrio TaxID=662 RepID=A0A8B3E347_VIBHA|nr:hypothetical protein [Vibrio parahaemolyticus]RIV98531.1 hypothetical protein DS957_028730 [Vibrio harveyi]EJG1899381.1 hypothetical protein [Vibrio parahaemolyticus]MDS1787262.1 hypothetical protein [Vibrio parahaemolyticus]OUD38138.1 hypothetical protein BS623_23760 [Vibrio parahaemolyticus]HBC3841365.1 hypothetical protein [Vibrio parahaemolyticus]
MNFDARYLDEFNQRFVEFRAIEADVVMGKRTENGCGKAFALLDNMELSYASGAYYGCLVLACTAIEASLNHEFGDAGNLKSKIEMSGYGEEIDWLRLLRNKIIHKNESSIVEYVVDDQQESELKELCKLAFIMAHTIYFDPKKPA